MLQESQATLTTLAEIVPQKCGASGEQTNNECTQPEAGAWKPQALRASKPLTTA
jgi:hypothetical protein